MAMTEEKRRRLLAAGFRVGAAEEFLGLSPAESALVEMKLALSAAIKSSRETHHVSQATLASRLDSSVYLVNQIEEGDPSTSTDLLLRALLATGATREEVGRVIAVGTIS